MLSNDFCVTFVLAPLVVLNQNNLGGRSSAN